MRGSWRSVGTNRSKQGGRTGRGVLVRAIATRCVDVVVLRRRLAARAHTHFFDRVWIADRDERTGEHHDDVLAIVRQVEHLPTLAERVGRIEVLGVAHLGRLDRRFDGALVKRLLDDAVVGGVATVTAVDRAAAPVRHEAAALVVEAGGLAASRSARAAEAARTAGAARSTG